ncbi:hypothetical protein [Methylomonas koyamae]|nr:hypothetical protein [Methylomonas koyamae]
MIMKSGKKMRNALRRFASADNSQDFSQAEQAPKNSIEHCLI